ncbi:hypothetical protein OCU04_000877 [Sclerotinia nivalis]|uniref:Uncharacterized protein n=1 Tax=Sclerotinia nivalis TaxID=352851 RepID=A0A9X0DP73_9HELO|nr:hypothetical protein OCU04_000877 [Sclerotinia nivalis]
MPPIKIWNAWHTLNIKYPTHCQWEIDTSSPIPDSCLRTLSNPTSRNILLENLEFELPCEAITHLENLATQSLCLFCGGREERRNVLFVAWKLKLNEVLSVRLRFFADQEMALLDTQEEMRGREEVLVGRVKVAEVKYQGEVRGHEVSKKTIQNLLGKVERAGSRHDGEAQQHEVSKRTIHNLLEKVELGDLRYEREVQRDEVSKRTIQELLEKLESKDTELSNQSIKFDEKTSKLSEEISSLKEENIRLRDQRASMQWLWQRKCGYHNQEINTLNAVVKTFVSAQQRLTDKWAASDAAMDLKFKGYLLGSATGVQEGVTNGALPPGSGSDLSDGMVETPQAKKRKFQATVEDSKDC